MTEELRPQHNIPNPEQLGRVRRINGIPLSLGTLSYEELMGVYESCLERQVQAASEGDVVAKYLDARFGNGPEPESAA